MLATVLPILGRDTFLHFHFPEYANFSVYIAKVGVAPASWQIA